MSDRFSILGQLLSFSPLIAIIYLVCSPRKGTAMNHLSGASWRPVYLRLSVTDHCNLRCRYCRPESRGASFSRDSLATDDELLGLVAAVHAEFPIYKIRITGGEPLLRPRLPALIARIRAQMPQ